MKSTKPLPDENNSKRPVNSSTRIKVVPIADVKKRAERLMKKYASLVEELRELEEFLRQTPAK